MRKTSEWMKKIGDYALVHGDDLDAAVEKGIAENNAADTTFTRQCQSLQG